jgi:hypothetical protein
MLLPMAETGRLSVGGEMNGIANISDFRVKKPEWVFECACGSQLFFLNHDGTIECRSCKHVCETIEWTYRKTGQSPK